MANEARVGVRFVGKDDGVTKTTRKIDKEVKGLDKRTGAFGKNAGASLARVGVAFAGVTASVVAFGAAVSKAFDFAQFGARVQQVRDSFRSIARAAGDSGDRILGSLRAASRGVVSEMDLMLAASRANLLGLPVDRLDRLMQIARASAMATGQEVGQMFDDIVTGIGRASPLILDNLGITVKIGQANERYAQTVGKATDALSKQEQTQALLNAVLEQGDEIIAKVGDGMNELTSAETFAKMASQAEDLRAALGEAVLPLIQRIAGGLGTVLESYTEVIRKAVSQRDAARRVNEILGGQEALLSDINSLETFILAKIEEIEKLDREIADLQGQVRMANGEINQAAANHLNLLKQQRAELVAQGEQAVEHHLALRRQLETQQRQQEEARRLAEQQTAILALATKTEEKHRSEAQKLEAQLNSLVDIRGQLREGLSLFESQSSEASTINLALSNLQRTINEIVAALAEARGEMEGMSEIDFSNFGGLGLGVGFGGAQPGRPRAGPPPLDLSQLELPAIRFAPGPAGFAPSSDALTRPMEAFRRGAEEAARLMRVGGEQAASFGNKLKGVAADVVVGLRNMRDALVDLVGRGLRAIGEAALNLGQRFFGLILQSEAMRGLWESLSNALAPIIDFLGGALSSALEPLIGIFHMLAEAVAGPLATVFQAIGEVLNKTQPFWEALGALVGQVADILARALVPLFQALVPILNGLAPLFALIGQILSGAAPIIEGFALFIAKVGAAFGWLLGKLSALGQILLYIVTFRWGKLDTVSGGGSLRDALAGVTGITDTTVPAFDVPTGGGGDGTSVFGGRTTVQRVPDIFVTLNFQAPVIGAGGMEEVGGLMVEAITDYVGAGGEITFLEGGETAQ